MCVCVSVCLCLCLSFVRLFLPLTPSLFFLSLTPHITGMWAGLVLDTSMHLMVSPCALGVLRTTPPPLHGGLCGRWKGGLVPTALLSCGPVMIVVLWITFGGRCVGFPLLLHLLPSQHYAHSTDPSHFLPFPPPPQPKRSLPLWGVVSVPRPT